MVISASVRLKKIICILICLIYCLLGQSEIVAANASLETLTAKSIYLFEARTGRVVYEKNSEDRLFPASTTKMMTTLLALEQGNLNDLVTVGSDAAGLEGSSMQLRSGDKLSLEDLLYGIMMVSGNDATVAVADHLAGNVSVFAKMMTNRAKEIGAVNTNFMNSSGLPASNHYSTAADLGKIAQFAYNNTKFRQLIKTQRREIHIQSGRKLVLENTNLLLGSYQGSNGIKTGYTRAAGECLVASAERNGVHLIAVLMNVQKDQRWREAKTLLDYGFEKIKAQFMFDRHALVKDIHVHDGTTYKITARPKMDIVLPIMNNDSKDFSLKWEMPDFVEAPIRSGQQFGYVKILYKGQEVDKMEMIADQDVNRGFSIFSKLVACFDVLWKYFND